MADLDFLDSLPDDKAPALGAAVLEPAGPGASPPPAASISPNAGQPDFLNDLPDARLPIEDNYHSAVGIEPNAAAKVQGLSQKLQVPEKAVENHLHELSAASEAPGPEYWTNLSKQAPKTHEFLAEPQNMKVAHDDISNLARQEHLVRGYTFSQALWDGLTKPLDAARKPAESISRYLTTPVDPTKQGMVMRSLTTGAARFNASAARIPGAAYDIMSIPQNLFFKAIGHPEQQVRAPEGILNNPVAKFYDKQAEVWKPPELDQDMVDQVRNGDYKGAARTLAAQVIANSPSQALLLAGAAAGYGLPTLIGMGAQQAAQTAAENRARGADPAMGSLDALTQGIYEAQFESLGTAGLFKSWESAIAKQVGKDGAKTLIKDAVKTLAHTFLGEGNEEFWTSLAQDFSSYAYGTNPEAMKGSLGRAVNAFGVGAVSGGLMTAPAAIGAGTYRGLEIQRAEQAKNLYLAMGSSAEASALRQRLPEKHQEFVQRVTADSAVDHVYIDPEQFQTYFQEKNIDADAAAEKLGISDALKEARATGGDIKIPMGAWIQNVVGTEHWKGLQDDVKFHPGDLSMRQASEVKERRTAELVTEFQAAQKDVEEAVKEPGWKATKDAAYQAVYQQLLDAGQKPTLAKANAELWATAAIAEARAQGTPPDQITFKGEKLNIVANLTPEQVAQQATQSGELEKLIARRTELEAQPASNEAATQELVGVNAEIEKLTQAAGRTVSQEELQPAAPQPEPRALPVIAEEANTGPPHAVFSFNWRMSADAPPVPYFRLYGDPALIQEATMSPASPKGNAWRSDVPIDVLKRAGIPVVGKTPSATEEPAIPRTFYQGPAGEPVRTPTFFSQLERTIEQKMPNKANAEQIRAIVTNNQVKPEEIEWSGFNEWLDSQRGPVTRQDVRDFLRANALKIEELRHDERGRPPSEHEDSPEVQSKAEELRNQAADRALEDWYWEAPAGFGVEPVDRSAEEEGRGAGTTDLFGKVIEPLPKKFVVRVDGALVNFNDLSRWNQKNAVEEMVHDEPRGIAVFSDEDHALDAYYEAIQEWEDSAREDAYGEWLREHGVEEFLEEARNELGDYPEDDTTPTDDGVSGTNKWAHYQEPGGKDYGEMLFTLPYRKVPFGPEIEGYMVESHWREENVFAHVRFNTRTDEQGKPYLFLEEIQSDWHQEAREVRQRAIQRIEKDERLSPEQKAERIQTLGADYGYKHKLSPAQMARIAALRDERFQLSDEVNKAEAKMDMGPRNNSALRQNFERARAAYIELTDRINDLEAPLMGPSNAPFKKNWQEYVFKRMLRWATDKGFSKLAWTSGKIQVDRWRGRFQESVDKIQWKKIGTDAVEIIASKEGETKFTRTVPIEGGTQIEGYQAKLEDLIGDQMAGQVRDQVKGGRATGNFEGDSLQIINPTGMEGFYDKIVRDFANRYAKKWGSKVATGYLEPPMGLYGFRDENGMEFDRIRLTDLETAKKLLALRKADVDTFPHYHDAIVVEVEPPVPGKPIHVLEITPQMKQAVQEVGQTLFQSKPPIEPVFQQGGGDERGFTTFGQDKDIWVSILASADESTFAHEAAHIMLQRRFEFVRSGRANEKYMREWQTLAGWLGVTDGQTELTREQHEQFARGFELYLREGRAPSENLRSVFALFRRWLTRIYRDPAILGVQVSDAVRGVMDRMLASEDEINAAESLLGSRLGADIEHLAPEVRSRLLELAEQAHDEAVSQLLARQMKEISADRKDMLAKERANALRQAEKEVTELPEQKAIEGIRRATFQSRDGRKVAEQYLNPEGGMTDEDRTSWDMLADMYGYQNGQEMAQKILEAPSFKAEVTVRVNQHMSQFADLRNTDKIQEEALNALHNDLQTQLMATEVAAFQSLVDDAQGRAALKLRRRSEAKVEQDTIKEKAAELIRGKKTAEAVQFMPFFTAERNAAIKASKALVDKNYEKAAQYKRQQLLNHALAIEALRARRQVERWERYLADTQRKDLELFKKEEHFVQVAALLNRFGFERRDYDPHRRHETLQQWATRMEEETGMVNLPDWLLQDETYSVPYKQLPVGLLNDLVDALRNVQRVANAENTTVSIEKGRDINMLVAELAAIADRNIPEGRTYKPTVEPGKLEKARSLAAKYSFNLKKMATIMFRLDGNKDFGRWSDIFWNPVYDAANKESGMMRRLNDGLKELWAPYSADERVAMTKPMFVPELQTSMSKMRLIVLALNIGNDGNREKVFQNRPVGVSTDIEWNQEAVMDMLQNHLDQRDWDFVQRTWNFVNQLWPEASEMHKDLTGFAPKKVDPRPFDVRLPDGTLHHLEGGYFPLKRDPRSSGRAQLQETLESPLYTEQYPGWKAMTRTGHLKSRVVANYPVSLEISIINRHLRDVVHDIAFRPTIIDLRRLLNNEGMQETLRRYLGPEGFATVREWVGSVAGSTLYDHQATAEWEQLVGDLRKRTVVAVLFLKPAIFLQNFANVFLFKGAVDGFGTKDVFHAYFARGVMDYMPKLFGDWKSAKEIRDFVYSKSALMADRKENPDFSLTETQNKLFGENPAVREFAGWLMGTTDEATNIPMWLEAYNLALARGETDYQAVRYADRLIDSAVGSGRKYDQPGISRGSELVRALAMFYSFWSTEYQRWSKEAGRVIAPKDLPRFLGFAASRMILFNLASNVLSGGWPKDDENSLAWWLRQILGYPLNFFPGIRGAANVALDHVLGLKSYGYKPSPAAGAIETALDAVKAGSAYARGERELAPVLETISHAAAFAWPYPDQMNNVFWNAYNILEDGMEPQWRDLYRRRPKLER